MIRDLLYATYAINWQIAKQHAIQVSGTPIKPLSPNLSLLHHLTKILYRFSF
jgi:hypothetical protein